MINFNINIGIDSMLNKKSLKNNASILDSKNIDFKNLILDKNNHIYKNDTKENNVVENTEIDIIEVNIKEDKKEELFKSVNELLKEELKEEELFNIINSYFLIEFIDSNNGTNISVEEIEFVDFEKLDLQQIGSFTLEDSVLKVPMVSLNSNDDMKKIDFLFKDESISKISLKELSFNNEVFLEQEGVFENKDVEAVADVIDVIDKYIISNKKDIFVNLNESEMKNELLKKINDKFNLKEMSYVAEMKNDNSLDKYSEKVNEFNDFLTNQRIGESLIKVSKTENSDLDKLLKLSNSKGKNEVTHMLNPNIPSFETSISDTIGSTVLSHEVRYAHLESDISNSISFMEENDIQELVLKVKPKDLGELTIKLLTEDNVSKVIITAEREDVVDLIKKNLTKITFELQESGIKIDNLAIESKHKESAFEFMSNSNENNSKNKNDSNRNTPISKGSLNNKVDVISSKTTINTVENEINLLA